MKECWQGALRKQTPLPGKTISIKSREKYLYSVIAGITIYRHQLPRALCRPASHVDGIPVHMDKEGGYMALPKLHLATDIKVELQDFLL